MSIVRVAQLVRARVLHVYCACAACIACVGERCSRLGRNIFGFMHTWAYACAVLLCDCITLSSFCG